MAIRGFDKDEPAWYTDAQFSAGSNYPVFVSTAALR